MIESNIVNWIELGDSMQTIDIYSRPKLMKFYNLIKILISFKKFSIFFYIVLKCFYFLQIIMLNLTNLTDENDNTVKILKYLSTVIFVQDIITDSSTYEIAVYVNTSITFLSIFCLIYIIISDKIGKFLVKFPISIFNLINILLLNYFIGPIVQISIMATKCTDGSHDFLKTECYNETLHIIFVIMSITNLIYWVIMSIILSIYFNEIGSINETKVLARVNTNYEIYTNLSKISMFIFAYLINGRTDSGDTTWRLVMQIYMMVNCVFFAFYVYKSVLFYDTRINNVILYGWVFVAWFSVVIFLKSLLDLNDTSIFHITGLIIISAIIYYLKELREEYLLTDFNIFEAKSLKDIELFNMKLFNLMNMRSFKNKTLLTGIIKKFEELIRTNDEMKEKYYKFFNNDHMKKKFNSNKLISIYSIVYIIYDHYLEKSNMKNDILLNICYFLINKMKNVTYAVFLCSKIKAISHKQMYLKYLLMEEIKTFMINKLSKSNNKESIKHIQLGSSILNNIYCDLFRVKIYDSACFQIEYFDLLRNNITTSNSTENFLNLGEDILILRKEIIKLWEKMMELNPFNEEAFREYTIYLRDIIQDDILLRNETKKFHTIKFNKISERNNMYSNLFNENSSIILVDGYFTFGKILYTSPNFPALYNYNSKEVLSMEIDDLCPTVIKECHREIIENAIKYSNISVLFNKQRDFLIRGKNGNLHNIKFYIKCVPNLSYGLIYMVNIFKIVDTSYIIVLDKDFRISSYTDIFTQGISLSSNNFGYSFDRIIINSHLGIVLPDILLQLEYKEDYGFFLSKDDFDLKGILYNLSPSRSLNEKVELVLEKIKLYGKLNTDNEGLRDSIEEYDDLLREITSKSQTKHSVFYKIITRSFMNKFRYYKVYISNDLITMHENRNSNTGNFSTGLEKNQNNKNKINNKHPDKNSKLNIKEDSKKDESKNRVKIRMELFKSGEEENKLLEKQNKENENKEKQEDELKELSIISSKNNSALSKSSIDSASFNKLKNGILEKKEVTAIKFMKYMTILFGICTIILIVFSTQASTDKILNTNKYLRENLYFDHSKISLACVYFSSLNLKFIKNKIYDDSRCYIKCTSFYRTMIRKCITDIKFQKENSSYFFQDFLDILSSQKIISLNIFNFAEKNNLIIDIDNNLNLIVGYGLKIFSNISDYLTKPKTIFDTIVKNIIEQSLLYINDEKITGFDETQKKINLEKSIPNSINIILIVEGGKFIVLIILFSFLICRLYSLENLYLSKIIRFKNNPFENYLKFLDDLKKKLRNNNEDEDDRFNNQLEDIEEINEDDISNKKSNSEDEKNKENNKKSKQNKDRLDEEKKKKAKKRDEKSIKKIIKNYQTEKIITMGKYFFKWNIFFFLKVISILLLSASYYLVISVVEKSIIEDMLKFDYTNTSIEGIYKESFMIYLNLKTEFANYVEYEMEKREASREFYYPGTNTKIKDKIVFYKGNNYFNPEQLMTSGYYKMNIPSQIDTPKVGTLLMPITSLDISNASNDIKRLNQMYNSDSCAVLFNAELQKVDYYQCSIFWSGILLKGMEQSITQMSVVITNVLDDLNSLIVNSKTMDEILAKDSVLAKYEQFMEMYMTTAYTRTGDIFDNINQANLKSIQSIYNSTMIGYICFVIILFLLMMYFVYKSKDIFNSFMNFIGILPVKYLLEDPDFYKELLKLEQYIYY